MSNADELLTLYQAFLEGSPVAFDRLGDKCRPRLIRMLRGNHLYLPRDIIEDAAADALLALYQFPHRFDAAQGSLLNYLKTIADRRLIDAVRRQMREKVIFVGGNVALEIVESKHYREEEERPLLWDDREAVSQEFAALIAEILPDPVDRQIAALFGQRTDTADIAVLLGSTHLPLPQQKAEAKRNRDRILKKLQRRRKDFRRFDE